MRWLLKPIMRPIARRRLTKLYADRNRIEAAIIRARKSKGRVQDLYDMSLAVTIECHEWERWLD